MMSFFTDNNTEKDIIAGLKAGGAQRRMAEKKLFETFFYFIKNGANKYSISMEDAASAYSDTIIKVIENLLSDKFEGRSSLKSYTFRIFLNKCVDIVRKETTNKQIVHQTDVLDNLLLSLPDGAKSVVQKMIDRNEHELLTERLAEVGEKCRQLLLLFEDGYSDKEIAGIMEYNSPEVVKTSRLRCLEKLKKKFLPSRLN